MISLGRDAFSKGALAYFDAHAIDPELARALGVREQKTGLVFGESQRCRSLNGGPKVAGPAGAALSLWWPAGHPTNAEIALVCEGESDALAALTAMSISERELPAAAAQLLTEIAVAAMPGTGFPAKRLADELADVGVREVLLALDADDAGHAAASRITDELVARGVRVVRIEFDAGMDLADALAAADRPSEWLAGAVADAQAVAPTSTADDREQADVEWPLLPGALPPFPLDALPGPVAKWAAAVAEETQTPPDLVAMAALGVLSAAAFGRPVVDCGAWEEESLGLYLLVAMESGERKSTVLRHAVAPLRDIERDWQAESADRVRELRMKLQALIIREQKLAKTAGQADNPEDRHAAHGELVAVATEREAIGDPVEPRLLADDATPEAIAGLLARHPRIAVLAAEAPLLDNLTGRYSENTAPNFHIVCNAYTGESTQIDRRGGRDERIDRPLMAITLTVQPRVLEALAGHEIARKQGLVARFAFALPETRLGHRRIDSERVPRELREAWAAVVRHTSNAAGSLTQPTDHDARASSVSSVSTSLETSETTSLLFSPTAKRLFNELREALEPRLREDADLRPIADWVNRHPGRIARIAGLLHLAEHSIDEPISESTMRAALRIGEYLLAHSAAALTVRDDFLRRCLHYLAARPEPTVSQRDLHRGPLNSRGPADKAKELAERLVALGALRALEPAARGEGRPPSPAYEINPRLRGEDA